MVRSHHAFEIRQVRSHLFLSRPRIHSPKKRWDCGEFLKELSNLESVPEKISRIDDRIKELEQEDINDDIAIANLDDRLKKATEIQRKIAERLAKRRWDIKAIEKLKQALARKKN